MIGAARGLLDVLFASLWQGACVALVTAAVLVIAGHRLNAATRCIVLQTALVTGAFVPLATTLPSVITHASIARVSGLFMPQGALRTSGSTSDVRRLIDVRMNDATVGMLALAWAGGVLVFILRIAAGSLQLARLVRRSYVFADRAGVTIFASPDVGIPLAIGFAVPSILIPAALAARADEIFECIVLHELAHVRRGDAYGNACDRAIHALLYFNPAVLVMLRAISLEREIACDDWAIARSCDVATYTRSLASFALYSSEAGYMAARAAPGFGRAAVTRIKRLEDTRHNGAPTLSRYALGGFTLVFISIVLAVQSFAPAIAFTAQVPASKASMALAACAYSEARYVSGPAPIPAGHAPSGLKTLVRVTLSSSGKFTGASIYKPSGNAGFDRAVLDAARKGVYAPQMRDCRPLSGQYMFEASTG